VLGQIEEEYKHQLDEQETQIKNLAVQLAKSHDDHLSFKMTTDKRIGLLEMSLNEKDELIKKFGSLKQPPTQNYFFATKPQNPVKCFNGLENTSTVQPSTDKHFIDEQQQKIKELLKNTISSKQDALEQAKLKQIQSINTLKLKLDDVEQMSENYSTSYKSV
jgi:hypothetical protein